MGRLQGKVAIVTGAAMGMGAATAELFAKEGAKVVATDLNEEVLNQTVSKIAEAGGEVIGLKHNVANEEEWKAIVAKTIERFGKLDVLINNAGISTMYSLENEPAEEWNKVMAVNVNGVQFGMRHAIPEMRKAGGGSIVNISSIAGIVGMGASSYSASKGATRVLTKATAVQYAAENIRVNSIHPGIIVTPMTAGLMEMKEYKDSFEKETPLPRLGKPEDIAYGALYLASDESSFVTGIELVIDGGYIAK
ncbi:SDR family NAD(P)-dependent oxidoreductase [Paenibacillus sp. J2TS4]|uniref:SDR family NAD(P)-dependent oxidoreductase n=1 Tax=Paenibacillus sp. J2TS4 TaxID=2807194 RepID=UPI001B2F6EFE|nr:glucose 1-dehydrogenase [Paenibacillus sp. J2TS4]GIP34524.1 2,5-dichloro-2,5-cyclohexadiene-1,4-diol dehydrogenase [Paenibacillus sp. J2TS4]